jgi:hypothetical protein
MGLKQGQQNDPGTREGVQMVRVSVTEKLARNLLADHGLAIIWKLHNDAATLYRGGTRTAAETFLEIADATENQLLHEEPARITVW